MSFKEFIKNIDSDNLRPEVFIRVMNFKLPTQILEQRNGGRSNIGNQKTEALIEFARRVPFIDIEKYHEMDENDALDELMDVLEEHEKNYPGTTGY